MTPLVHHVQSSVRQGVLVLEIKDKSLDDYERAHKLRDELVAGIAESPNGIVLDLRHVEHLTSAALLPFVEVRTAAQAQGKRVVLCNLADVVATVLTVSELLVESTHGHYLEMADDLESAIASLKSPQ